MKPESQDILKLRELQDMTAYELVGYDDDGEETDTHGIYYSIEDAEKDLFSINEGQDDSCRLEWHIRERVNG
jgi:hypothetical protein